jgi:hypothetical protein
MVGPAGFLKSERSSSCVPAAVVLGLQRLGALAGVKLLPPEATTLAAELESLHQAVAGIPDRPRLAEVLVALARDPHQLLRMKEFWVAERYARRLHPSRLSLTLVRGRQEKHAQKRRLILGESPGKGIRVPGPAAASTADTCP